MRLTIDQATVVGVVVALGGAATAIVVALAPSWAPEAKAIIAAVVTFATTATGLLIPVAASHGARTEAIRDNAEAIRAQGNTTLHLAPGALPMDLDAVDERIERRLSALFAVGQKATEG